MKKTKEFIEWKAQFDADLDDLEKMMLEIEFETPVLYRNHHWLDMLRIRKQISNALNEEKL